MSNAEFDWKTWLIGVNGLTSPQRRVVRSAVANSALEGHVPTQRDMERLIRMITGRLTFTQYRAEVLRDASVTPSTAVDTTN
jgi:hypothetical protein